MNSHTRSIISRLAALSMNPAIAEDADYGSVRDAIDEIENLSATAEAHALEIEDLKDQVSEAQDAAAELSDQIDDRDRELAELDDLIAEKDAEIDEYRTKAAHAEADADAARDELGASEFDAKKREDDAKKREDEAEKGRAELLWTIRLLWAQFDNDPDRQLNARVALVCADRLSTPWAALVAAMAAVGQDPDTAQITTTNAPH